MLITLKKCNLTVTHFTKTFCKTTHSNILLFRSLLLMIINIIYLIPSQYNKIKVLRKFKVAGLSSIAFTWACSLFVGTGGSDVSTGSLVWLVVMFDVSIS